VLRRLDKLSQTREHLYGTQIPSPAHYDLPPIDR
jgi:hypothetical protein